jgi:hypothetical protein
MTLKYIRESRNFFELKANIAEYLEERENNHECPDGSICPTCGKGTPLVKEDDAPLEIPTYKRLKVKIIDEIIPISEKQFGTMYCLNCLNFSKDESSCLRTIYDNKRYGCEDIKRKIKLLKEKGYII